MHEALASGDESLLALNLRLVLALMPCWAMSLRTRSLPTRMPRASSSFHIRGQPYSALTWAWMALMCASSASLLIPGELAFHHPWLSCAAYAGGSR